MARTSPTEESLGLGPTAEELATISSPADDNDDIPIADDEPTPVVEATQPGVKDVIKAPEVVADPAAKPEDPKTVDLRALQEARAEAREAKQRNALLEARTNEMLAMFNRQTAPQADAKPAVAEIPPEDDVIGRINWLVNQFQTQSQQTAEERQAQAQQNERQQTLGRLGNLEDAFRASAPDYDAAVQFAGQSREAELELMYPLSTKEQREQAVLQEWDGIVQQSIKAGVNPAEQVYKFAKMRGFTGAAPAPTPAPQAQPNLRAVAEAQQRHQSLSDAPGGETVAPLDAKALARMSDKEFKAWMSKKGNEAKFDEIMGR